MHGSRSRLKIVLAEWLQLVLDGRRDGGRRPDRAATAASANREAIIDALIACYDDGILRAERAGSRRPRRRVGPFGAQPLRRRRGAAREVAQRQWERCAPLRGRTRSSTLPVRRAGRAARRAARRDLRRGHAGAPGRAAVGCTSRRRSPRTSRASTARCAARSSARSRARRPTRSTRSTRSRRGTRGTACARAQGCSVAPRPPNSRPQPSERSSKESV